MFGLILNFRNSFMTVNRDMKNTLRSFLFHPVLQRIDREPKPDLLLFEADSIPPMIVLQPAEKCMFRVVPAVSFSTLRLSPLAWQSS